MANVEINAITSHFRGKIGDVVFRRRGSRLITALRPKPSQVEPSPATLARRKVFSAAIKYAQDSLDDPALLEVYERAAERKGDDHNAFNVAVGDFFNKPTIEAIDLTHYTGHVGDKIEIDARDDVDVMSVHVVIKAANGSTLEEGEAALLNRKWSYPATTTLPAGQPATIEATATDRPKHKGTLTAAFTMPG